jgi:hypothetical protein
MKIPCLRFKACDELTIAGVPIEGIWASIFTSALDFEEIKHFE